MHSYGVVVLVRVCVPQGDVAPTGLADHSAAPLFCVVSCGPEW